MNNVIAQLTAHATVRDYVPDHKLNEEAISQIISSAKQAPSWMNGQPYSILMFKTEDEKNELAELILSQEPKSNNPRIIKESSLFLLFCIDFYRYQANGANFNFAGEIEPLLIGTTDTALAVQNAATAAEGLGLGTCIVGGIRRMCNHIIDNYELPNYVFPLIGLAIGKPAKETEVKPRMSNNLNVFSPHNYPKEFSAEDIAEYVKTMHDFTVKRGYSGGNWFTRFENYYTQKKYAKGNDKVLKDQKLI